MAGQISFSHIPQGIRVPLFYAEFAAANSNLFQQDQKTLLIGQTITAQPAQLTPCNSVAQARALFGNGSMLARMVEAYRADDLFGEIWVIPLADASGGVAASGSVAFSGTTAAGVISLYIAGRLVSIPVTAAETDSAIATAVAAAINAVTSLPVTAAVDGSVNTKVDITAKNKGTLGNDIDIRVNYNGPAGGEATPAGLTITIVAMASGATDPDLTSSGTDVAALMGDNPFDFICSPYTGSTQRAAVTAAMNDSTGRWSYARQSYGHVFSAKRFYGANEAAAEGSAVTFGATVNDPHLTIMAYYDSPTPPAEWAAEYMAASAVALRADPARPLQTLVESGLLAPPIGSRFSFASKQAILSTGLALSDYRSDGTVQILRAVTTYQTNAFGNPDQSYLDTETLYTLMAIVRRLKGVVTQKFARCKLADDGTNFGFATNQDLNDGASIVTPSSFKAELIAQYGEMIDEGLVEDEADFAAGLIVQRNSTDASRLDVLFDPILVSGLRIVAVLNQFALQPPLAA